MKKIISVSLMLIMLISLFGCKSSDKARKRKDGSGKKETVFTSFTDDDTVDYDDLKENDWIMFTACQSNCGLVSSNEDYWCYDNFILYYDGTLEIKTCYNLSGFRTARTELSDEDYKAVYDFAYDGYINDTYKDYKEDACDGSQWSFCFCDTDETTYCLYSGYAYVNESMNSIEKILYKYADEADFTSEIPDEGLMLDTVVRFWEPIDYSTDNICGLEYVISYDKTIEYYELYTLSGRKLISSDKMSDYEFKRILEFCLVAKRDDPYKDYSEDVCDGETWTFVFYDGDGESILIYDGYIYDHFGLSSTATLISSIVE